MQKIETKKGIILRGQKVQVLDNELCKKIRARLKMTRRQLSNADIYKVIKLSNIEIGNWMLENTEGFNVFKNMGVLAISEYTPVNLKPDLEESIERIKNSSLPTFLKERILKKYTKPQRYNNYSTYENYARPMWFNKKNCSSKKADVYRWEPSKELKTKLAKKIKSGMHYQRYTFQDFYSSRTHPEI